MAKSLLSPMTIMLLVAGVPQAAEITEEQLVGQAVLPLPAHLRQGASVVKFDGGERMVLRPSDNGLICQPDDPDSPGIAIWCYPKSHDAYARRWYQLTADGGERAEVDLPWFMPELNRPRRMETIWDGLKGRGISDGPLEKIMGANVRRVYTETIG